MKADDKINNKKIKADTQINKKKILCVNRRWCLEDAYRRNETNLMISFPHCNVKITETAFRFSKLIMRNETRMFN